MARLVVLLIVAAFLSAALAHSTMHRNEARVAKAMSAYRELVKTQKAFDFPPGQNMFTIQRPEGVRTYYVYVPMAYNSSTPSPVLFAFHGLGDQCADFGPATGFQELSEELNFLYVYPCGTDGLLGVAWNAGTCCLDGSPIDDVMFTRLIVQDLQKNFNVDALRVYISGFSNGAFMSEILTCQAPDIMSGSASVSGIVEMNPGNSGGESACDAAFQTFNKNVPMTHIHGNLDFVVPWTGDELLGFPPVPTDFADWATRQNCQGAPVNTFTSGPYSNQRYENCGSGVTLDLVLHQDGGHEWPRDQYFDVAVYIVNYFNLNTTDAQNFN